jgi:dolichol-phosphate mannosyltransferase
MEVGTDEAPDGGLDLSVVVPVLDERESLVPLQAAIRQALDPTALRYEVLYIDDGSTDGSFEVLEKLHAHHPEVRVVQLRRNAGKAAAYAAGFGLSRGATIATLDADLQDDPAEIPKLLEHLDGETDLVNGWRRHRADPALKVLLSRAFNLVASRLLGLRLHDLNCGLRVLRRGVARDLLLYGELHRFIPALAHGLGYGIAEAEVRHHPRAFARSRYGWSRLPKGVLDLLTVFLLGRFRERPLHLFGGLGVVTGLAGLGIDAYIASLWLRYGDIQGRHPLLMLGVLLSVLGVQLFCTGLVAELVARQRPQPRALVRRILDGPREGGGCPGAEAAPSASAPVPSG